MRHATHSPRTIDAPVEQIVTLLRRFGLVAGLTAVDLSEFAARCSLIGLPANRPLFEEGDQSEGLWIITSGRVRLQHLMADGRRHVVGFRAPTNAVDLSSGIDGRPYSATATTLEASEFLLMPRDVVIDLGRRHPVIVRNAVDLLCLEVRQRDITTAIAALADARGRIGCALLQLARQFGVTNGTSVRINYRLTRQDIADRAGVTVETAIRVLSDLQQRNVARTEAQVIDLLDVEYIRQMIGCDDCQFECSVFAPVPPRELTPA